MTRDTQIEELAAAIEEVIFAADCSIKGSELRKLLKSEMRALQSKQLAPQDWGKLPCVVCGWTIEHSPSCVYNPNNLTKL